MDRETAQVVAIENYNKQPSQFDKSFEALFANEHFGDVVTEVFPDVLDQHSKQGMDRLAKYAGLASFLCSEANSGDGRFVVVKLQTERAEYRHDNTPPRQSAEALALYSYAGLSADSFRVMRNEDGTPLGIAVDHIVKVYSFGFNNGVQKVTRQTVVIDSIDSLTSAWTREKEENQTPSYFITGVDGEDLHYQARKLDSEMRVDLASPITGAISSVLIDDLRVSAGLETEFPVATE